MAQINPVRRLSLSLSSQKAGQKQKGQILAVSAQLMALVSALRSLSSVALSSARVSPVYHPFLTPLRQGDISTLQNRGHLYFALTPDIDCSARSGDFSRLQQTNTTEVVTTVTTKLFFPALTFLPFQHDIEL